MKKLSNIEKENIAKKALKNEKFLEEIIDNLSENCDKRWPSFQVLNHMSERYPEALYPKWDYLTDLFRTGNSYTKYATIYILANLTKVDKKTSLKNYLMIILERLIQIEQLQQHKLLITLVRLQRQNQNYRTE